MSLRLAWSTRKNKQISHGKELQINYIDAVLCYTLSRRMNTLHIQEVCTTHCAFLLKSIDRNEGQGKVEQTVA